ncbi:hypothetical protein U6B65_07145 [Oscillospiraceae bacterium MB08-C2-2]|nr:hypothetical protein U6B65_07145 [Oscillospiraceae bacterium MB08-C2-2]
MNNCPKCKSVVSDDLFFCSKCGERLLSPSTSSVSVGADSRTRLLVVTRASQFQCVMNTYRVVVDGNLLGNVASGSSLTSHVSNWATVDIICTTIMVSAKRRLVLKVGEKPIVSFKVQWPGSILASVQDAEIVEQKTDW